MYLPLPALLLLLVLIGEAEALSHQKQIDIVNQCQHGLRVGYQTNGNKHARAFSVRINSDSHRLIVDSEWAGRIWARPSCESRNCGRVAGATSPASLAEFKMTGANGVDYYDVSFVDGYNLPIRIAPTISAGLDQLDPNDPMHCRPTVCKSLPVCPVDLRSQDSKGRFVACASACSRYQDDAYCCTGEFSTPETCSTNHYANAVKDACPNSYSYAYDDKTSVYVCKARHYTVTFCP